MRVFFVLPVIAALAFLPGVKNEFKKPEAFVNVGAKQISAPQLVDASQGSKSNDKSRQNIQDELNSERNKKKIIESYQESGFAGLKPEDISLILSDYSDHYTDDSGKPRTVIVAECHIKGTGQITGMTKNLRGDILQTEVDKDRIETIVGLIDIGDHTLTLFGKLRKGAKPDLRVVGLRKDAPEYILLGLAGEDGSCDNCDPILQVDMAIIGFDSQKRIYTFALKIQTHNFEFAGGSSWEDDSTVEVSDWVRGGYREIIVTTNRSYDESSGQKEFTMRKEIYSWNKQGELFLAERMDDGAVVLSRSASPRLHQVQQLQAALLAQPNVQDVLKLIDFFGDENPIVAREIWDAFRIFLGVPNRKLDKPIVNALINKIRNGSPLEKLTASGAFSEEDLKDLEPSVRRSLVEWAGEESNLFFLSRMISLGESGDQVLHVLMKKLEKTLDQQDGCNTVDILDRIKTLAEQNIDFQANYVAVIKNRVMKNPLLCDDSSEFSIESTVTSTWRKGKDILDLLRQETDEKEAASL